ncbi:hypothetical protein GGI22_005640, partial [Coemansia erecta]
MFEQDQRTEGNGRGQHINHGATGDRYQFSPPKRRDEWENKSERPLSIQSLLNTSNGSNGNEERNKWDHWQQPGGQAEAAMPGYSGSTQHVAAYVAGNNVQRQSSLRGSRGVAYGAAQAPRYSSASIAASQPGIVENHYHHHSASGGWNQQQQQQQQQKQQQHPMHAHHYDPLSHLPLPATVGGNEMVADHRRVFHAEPHASGVSAASGAHEYPHRSQYVARTQTDQIYTYGGAATDMRFHP